MKVALFLSLGVPAIADSKVVDPWGGGDYTTIQAAVNALPAAGPRTITVKPGTYNELVFLDTRNAGATNDSQRVIFIADPAAAPGSVVVTAAGLTGTSTTAGHAFTLMKSKFITMDGFNIKGGSKEGVYLLGGSSENTGITISSNDIHHNGSSDSSGGIFIGRGNANTWVVNNLIRSNGRNGFSIEGGSTGAPTKYIVNNTFYKNAWNGLRIARNERVILANNLIVGNGTASGTTGGRFGLSRESVSGAGTPTLITLFNNMFYKNTQADMDNISQTLDSTDSNNRTTSGSEGVGISGSVFVGGSSTHPFTDIFVDPDHATTPNHHLISTSTAIDLGVNSLADGALTFVFAEDFEGDTRPLDGNGDTVALVDIGYDEFKPTNTNDTDNDGLPDDWEMEHFGNLNQGAGGDPDGDGLSNLGEYQHGTDPNNPDTDGDGANDGSEVLQGRNPLKGVISGAGIVNLDVYTPFE